MQIKFGVGLKEESWSLEFMVVFIRSELWRVGKIRGAPNELIFPSSYPLHRIIIVC